MTSVDMLVSSCAWDKASWLIFSENVFSPLIYYSHLFPLIASLLIGVFVLLSNPRGLTNKILFSTALFFSFWVYGDLVLWASEDPDIVMFFWSALLSVEYLIYASALYLVAVFANGGSDVSAKHKLIFLILAIPIILFGHTSLNLLGFDFTDCDREAIEGPLWQYLYIVEILIVGWTVHLWVRGYSLLKSSSERLRLSLVAFGTVVFLTLFSIGNILITYFLDLDWRFEQYKLFGMPLFVGFIAYSIVKFRTFKSKALLSEVLTVSLAVAVLSLLFIRDITVVQIVVMATFVLVCILGFILVRNVRREVEQREHIQVLADNLKVANEKLKELDKLKSQFLSIATHELRTPLTIVRNFVSLMMDGSYGKVPPAAEEAGRQVFERVNDMARSVDTYLNVSRIEQGKISYTFADTDFSRIVQLAVEGLKANAEKKRLELSLTVADCARSLHGNFDGPKLTEVVVNLLDNSIKYTPSGSVRVSLEKVGAHARLTIRDTGVGMSDKTKANLFKLFSPGEDAKKVNPASTGVGLYVSMAHVLAHKGTLTAQSEGVGKGSTFTLDLPLRA